MRIRYATLGDQFAIIAEENRRKRLEEKGVIINGKILSFSGSTTFCG